MEELKAPTDNALATGPFGSSISAKYFTDSGVPVIRGSNLSADVGTRLTDDGLVFLSTSKARDFVRSTARDGDLIFTCWGTVNQVGLVDSRAAYRSYIVSNKQMKFTPDSAKADSLFLYYLFSSPAVQQQISDRAIGSSVPGFNLGQLRAMRLKVPSIVEQRAIASTLGVLDDKIELNRRMNETLERIAMTIFGAWFLNFEGHIDLVSAPVGRIPLGWRVGSIADVSDNVRDSVDPTGLPASTAYVGLEHIPRRRATLEAWGRAEDVDSGKLRFRSGDTLFGKLRPYFHKVVPAFMDGICSTDVLVVRPHSSKWRWFTFGHLFSDGMVAHANATSDGTRMPRAKWSDLARYEIAVPPPEVAAEFDGIVAPLFARMHVSLSESRLLADLRDALLPKLISGELRISDAERLVSEVA